MTTPATRRTQRPTASQLAILKRCAGGDYIRLDGCTVPCGSAFWHSTRTWVDLRTVEACERKGLMERRTTISGRPVSVLSELGKTMLAEETTS